MPDMPREVGRGRVRVKHLSAGIKAETDRVQSGRSFTRERAQSAWPRRTAAASSQRALDAPKDDRVDLDALWQLGERRFGCVAAQLRIG